MYLDIKRLIKIKNMNKEIVLPSKNPLFKCKKKTNILFILMDDKFLLHNTLQNGKYTYGNILRFINKDNLFYPNRIYIYFTINNDNLLNTIYRDLLKSQKYLNNSPIYLNNNYNDIKLKF
jgi:hypothetical protein